MTAYRPDIDGLRAIAVIPVILFHMGISTFSGGYVGVDIFFVISGYLITSIIVGDALKNRFDIWRFYERRIRRIFPALFTVILASSILAYWMLLPNELKDFGQSVVTSTLFSSNFLFWLESGYFDAPAEVKPLLHTWSLAVEEQFYLFYPVTLIALIKLAPNKFRFSLFLLLLTSFICNIYLTKYAPSSAFYLAPGRMWELLLGALMALGYTIKLHKKFPREIFSLLGFLLICYSVFFLRKSTPFPGAYALLPCIGTAMVINAGIYGSTTISKLLSYKPIVWTGLISYSLYLWHWPSIVFTKLYLERPLQPHELVLLFTITFFLAFMSWHYIERPFRNKTTFPLRKNIFSGAATVMTVAIIFGVVLHLFDGLPKRVPYETAVISKSIEDYHNTISDSCFLNEEKFKTFNGELCHIGTKKTDVDTFVLWGDSHARAIIPAVTKEAEKKGVRGLFAGYEGCPPLLGVTKTINTQKSNSSSCTNFNKKIIDTIINNINIKHVILNARWVVNIEGVRLLTDPHPIPNIYLYDEKTQEISTEENINVFVRGLNRTLEALSNAGKEVIIFGPLPEMGANISAALARATMMGIDRDLRPSIESVKNRINTSLVLFNDAHVKYDIDIIYPHEVLCWDTVCKVEAEGMPLYFDDDHLSSYGAIYVSEKIATNANRDFIFFNTNRL